MVTFFATARAFTGHMDLIQRNAIRSWLAFCPPCEVILLGDDGGAAEVARQYGIRLLPQVERNELGTPLISSLFRIAQEEARNELLCQINADIMLTDDFLLALEKVRPLRQKFLISGQRWDVDLAKPWDFDRPGWCGQLRDYAIKYGKLHAITGLDYFVFVKGSLGEIPPFAIGRRVLDNWIVYRARCLGMPVIDATNAITAVHQNHGYSFHPQGEAGVMEGPEVDCNLKLAGGSPYLFTLEDATHFLSPSGLKLILSKDRIKRRLYTFALVRPYLSPGMRMLSGLLKTVKSRQLSFLKSSRL